ncbi:alpha/beta fold hydrolase [Halorarius litoreus]|uniref:alpha/beta fold hydrolase n=1 Tax=Halorarius litoreus TaxID=2962676 RepID=UPI0020CD4C44|nr:alpha/beta fold hydrolase [Halorarius litoreus]
MDVRASSRTVGLPLPDGRGGTDEVTVRYLVAGEGPPMVLLHGIGLDASDVSWRHTLPALAETHTVYALDFPGHGESGHSSRRYTTALFRATLEAFLDALDLHDAALVGISMGGCVALGHALDNPVEKLVLVDSYGLGGDAGWRPSAWALLRTPFAHSAWWQTVGATRTTVRTHLDALTGGAPSAELVEDVYQAIQERKVGRAVASWQRSEFRATGLKTDYRDRLDELDAETLFVHGTADPLIPSRWSRRAAEATDAELALFDGVGHWLPREQPAAFNERVAAFLA